MLLFLVGTFLVAGLACGGSLSPGTGSDLKGLPEDGSAPAALVTPALDPCKKFIKGGLKDIPAVSDLNGIKTSLGSGANDSIKTVERTVFSNTDEAGRATGNKTVVEKTTETDVQPGGNVSKTTETQVVVDKEGKISGEKNVTESETVTETTPEDGTLTTTTEVKKVTDDEGKEVSEEVVIKETATAPSLTGATEEKPQDGKAATLPFPNAGADDQGKNKSQPTFTASGKSDEPQKVNRTETTTKISHGNDTNEVLVTKEEQSVSSQGSVKVTSKESKNVTDKGDGKDVEKETVVQKEVERDVCNGDTKEVHDAKHLNEAVEDLKHKVIDVENKIKEEKAKAEEASVAAAKCTVPEATGAQEGVVVKTAAPAVRPAKVITKVVPSVVPSAAEGKVPLVTTTEKVAEQVKLPVEKEEKVEKVTPLVKKGPAPLVVQQKIVEKVPGAATEEKVPAVIINKVSEQAAPVGAEEIVAIPEEQEQSPVVIKEKVPLVTKRLVEKITPTAAQEKTVIQRKTVEEAASPAKENVVFIPQAEEE